MIIPQSTGLVYPRGVAGWDLSTASYDSVSFSVGTEESTASAVALKTDGTKMYIVGSGSDTVYQYSLSTAWDISTASYDSVSFSVGSQESVARGFSFKTDGTKMYIVGSNSDAAHQYSLSTAWDISTASYDSVSFSLATEDETPYDLSFKSDGTKLYILGFSGNAIYQYSLSTAWDISTASYDSVSFSVSSQESSARGVSFRDDGTKMYIVGSDSDSVYQYSLSTSWDLSTASYDSVSFSVASEETLPLGFSFKTDGTKMYIVGIAGDAVYQYSLG